MNREMYASKAPRQVAPSTLGQQERRTHTQECYAAAGRVWTCTCYVGDDGVKHQHLDGTQTNV